MNWRWQDVQTLPAHVYDATVEILVEDQQAWNKDTGSPFPTR